MRTSTWLPLLAGMALSAACSKNVLPPPAAGAGSDAAAPTGEQAPRPAKLLPLPGMDAPPANHAAGRSGPLEWDVPREWIEVPPESTMRQAQYRVPGSAGDAECVVFYFGPGQGGDPHSNAVRWANQFRQVDGGSSVDAMRVTALEDAHLPTRLVEVTGVYDGGMTMTDAPAEARENYMLLGGIAEAADAPWFFKFTGPEATVRAHRQAFVDMLESVRVGS